MSRSVATAFDRVSQLAQADRSSVTGKMKVKVVRQSRLRCVQVGSMKEVAEKLGKRVKKVYAEWQTKKSERDSLTEEFQVRASWRTAQL